MEDAKKSLGQHWLQDKASLQAMVDAADVKPGDTVLEVGPGHGSLTRCLVAAGANVTAIEKDEILARTLRVPGTEVVAGDILKLDLNSLPAGYKLVANIPYYLTAHLLRMLADTKNKPIQVALLVQKEVAERVCATPGAMSILSVGVQLAYQPALGRVVEGRLFSPPPKVDSRILILQRREEPLFDADQAKFMKLVKAGFGEKRKKLRSSLAGGLGIIKTEADELLAQAGIDGDMRAQNLSLEEWHKLYQVYS